MLDPELTEPESVVRRRRGDEIPLAELLRFEELFLLIARLRAASPDSLDALHFQRVLGVSKRHGARFLMRLSTCGYLKRVGLTAGRGIYHVTRRALLSLPALRVQGRDTLRRSPPFLPAHYCWLRSTMLAELARDGYAVGRSALERMMLRRFLVEGQRRVVDAAGGRVRREAMDVLDALRNSDALRVPFRAACRVCTFRGALDVRHDQCPVCGGAVKLAAVHRLYQCRACGHVDDVAMPHRSAVEAPRPCEGPMPERELVACDLAWKRTSSGLDVRLLVVDDPGRSLQNQLKVLPLTIAGQPRVPVILRSTDPASQLNGRTSRWHVIGSRHKALLNAFAGDGLADVFPFSLTTSVIDYRPGLELWRLF